MKGILGIKIGMTQVFSKSGKLTPVTAVLVEPNIVTQVKTMANDGYEAIQLAVSDKKERRANKPEMGHVKKANTTPKRFLREIRGVDIENYALGAVVKADIFNEGEIVDVTGISKGKGFQGVIKRHNQTRGPMSHGSHFHRRPGSMGPMRTMRVPKGKNLPGQMGGDTITIQNTQVISIDLENNVILIKGNVPGPNKGLVTIKTSVKNSNVVKEQEQLISYIEETPIEIQEEVTEQIETITSEEAPVEIKEEVIEQKEEITAQEVEEKTTEAEETSAE